MLKDFASDNAAGVHPDIMKALIEANQGHAIAYGHDTYTEHAISKFKDHFGQSAGVYFVFGGTGANVTGLYATSGLSTSVICPENAHINAAECGAPEKILGCKIISVGTSDGKLRVGDLMQHYVSGDTHQPRPRVVSISQPTELGTVYTPSEITNLADFAHEREMFLYMDGARISNAAVSLGTGFREFTTDAGVDVLSFGGTKNGMMYGEAVIILNPELDSDLGYGRKQVTQLPSKMRYIAAQFDALLTGNLWLRNARHANEMAQLLHEGLSHVHGVSFTQQVQANAVFATIPDYCVKRLQERYFFHVWDDKRSEVRLMCSFDTEEKDVIDFATYARELIA